MKTFRLLIWMWALWLVGCELGQLSSSDEGDIALDAQGWLLDAASAPRDALVLDATRDAVPPDASAAQDALPLDAAVVLADSAGLDPDAALPDAALPSLRIVSPTAGAEAEDPVTFVYETGGGVVTVAFDCEGWPLHEGRLPAEQGRFVYDFSGVNRVRRVSAVGYDAADRPVAWAEVSFTPTVPACRVPEAEGFNHYTVAAINDLARFPKDGTYPYCWASQGGDCGARWGQIYDGVYGGEVLFEGGGDCFCSGHTLEIFLYAYQLWLSEHGLSEDTLFGYLGSVLPVSSVDIGAFYQHWQGFGVGTYASSAEAFEDAGIGETLDQAAWDDVLPGDYVNLSRSTGSGHAVIFIRWVYEDGVRVGLRYYGCNGRGDSCPDADDPLNQRGNSGPSFVTEYFEGHGGTVLPRYLFIGRVYLPQ